MSNTTLKRVLVTGATGKQGGSAVRALVKSNESHPKFEILAVTRHPESSSAKSLTDLPHVTLVKGDLDDAPALFKSAGHVDAVFSVITAMGNGASPDTEEKQGKAIADAAEAAGVTHFVYSSVDRGNLPGETGVPHFDSKYRVEEYIKTKKLNWTFIRPAAFMDFAKNENEITMMTTYIKEKMRPTKALQMIATDDIGEFARIALEDPQKYIGKAMSIAGDELTFEELDESYKSVTGKPIPTTFFFVPTVVNVMPGLMAKEMRTMFQFFDEPGYAVNITECRAMYPGLKTFKDYLKQ